MRRRTRSGPDTGAHVEHPAPAPALACSDLVAPAHLTSALTGGSGAAPTVVPAFQPDYDLRARAVTAAGGLQCSWRAGTAPADDFAYEGDWAYFWVDILPNAADVYHPVQLGDAPTTQTKAFGSVTASATCGDPGCEASAVINDAWVAVRVNAAGWNSDRSIYVGIGESLLDHVAPAITDVFAAVGAAAPEQLGTAPPTASPAPSTAVGGCESFLPATLLASTLGANSATYVAEKGADTPNTPTDAAIPRAGLLICAAEVADQASVGFFIAPQRADLVTDQISTTELTAGLADAALPGALPNEKAVSDCPGQYTCSELFTMGGSGFSIIHQPHADAIAAAIIARAR